MIAIQAHITLNLTPGVLPNWQFETQAILSTAIPKCGAANMQQLDHEDKAKRIDQIYEAINNLHSSPLYSYRVEEGYRPVVGEGNLSASIMFIGEAPGKEEALTGRPFVGRAGQVLDAQLDQIGLNREDVYITNIVKDRPPDNRDPLKHEIDCYAPYLMEQIIIIDPEVIVTLGRFAMAFILQAFSLPEYGGSIGDLHGQVLSACTSSGPIKVLPLYHPAAIFYNRKLESVVKTDFQVLIQFI